MRCTEFDVSCSATILKRGTYQLVNDYSTYPDAVNTWLCPSWGYDEPEVVDVFPDSAEGAGDDASSSSRGATSFLGLIRSSSVTPSSFVIPTTGASPFFTNSHWPKAVRNGHNGKVHEELTWKLVPSQSKGISHNLLVDSALDLKQNLTDGHSRGPMVERAFTFTHSYLHPAISHIIQGRVGPQVLTSLPLT